MVDSCTKFDISRTHVIKFPTNWCLNCWVGNDLFTCSCTAFQLRRFHRRRRPVLRIPCSDWSSIHRSFTSRIHFECQHRECMRFCLRDRAVPTQKESRLQRKLYLEDRVWHVRENLFVYFRKVVQNQDVAIIRPLSALNAHPFWIKW